MYSSLWRLCHYILCVYTYSATVIFSMPQNISRHFPLGLQRIILLNALLTVNNDPEAPYFIHVYRLGAAARVSSASATFSVHACAGYVQHVVHTTLQARDPFGVLSRLNWRGLHPGLAWKVSSPTIKRPHTTCNFLIFITVVSAELRCPSSKHIAAAAIISWFKKFINNLRRPVLE